MKGIIIYSKEEYKKNVFFVERSKDCLREKGVELDLVFFENLKFVSVKGETIPNYNNENYIISFDNKPDFAIVRCINPYLSRLLERYGIRTFNSASLSEIANDKFLAYVFATNNNVKTIPSILCQGEILVEDINHGYKIFETDELIIKSVDGHGGSEVYCISEEKKGAYEIIKNLKNNKKYVLQPRIKGVAKDVRVYVLDNKPQCAILRESNTDYRSNYSLGGRVKEVVINKELESLIKCITDNIYMDYAGVDFVIDENGNYYFNEIEDVVGARMLYQCTDIDIISRFMCHIIDKVSGKYI